MQGSSERTALHTKTSAPPAHCSRSSSTTCHAPPSSSPPLLRACSSRSSQTRAPPAGPSSPAPPAAEASPAAWALPHQMPWRCAWPTRSEGTGLWLGQLRAGAPGPLLCAWSGVEGLVLLLWASGCTQAGSDACAFGPRIGVRDEREILHQGGFLCTGSGMSLVVVMVQRGWCLVPCSEYANARNGVYGMKGWWVRESASICLWGGVPPLKRPPLDRRTGSPLLCA